MIATSLPSPSMYCTCGRLVRGVEAVHLREGTYLFGRCECDRICRRKITPLIQELSLPDAFLPALSGITAARSSDRAAFSFQRG